MKMAVMILFMLLLVIGQMHANFHARCYRWLAAGFGVFAILFVCEQIANLLFGRENETSMWRLHGRWIVSYVSYASMACYMFHRLFFWIGEKLYNPGTDSVKWLYMAGIVFPVMLYLSYLIQRNYDNLIRQIQKE